MTGIQKLKPEFNPILESGKCGPNPTGNIVGPRKTVVIGLDDEDNWFMG
jgi:hypothetical protein